MTEKHISLDKAENGYVLYYRDPKEKDPDKYLDNKTLIFSDLEAALLKVKEYFHE